MGILDRDYYRESTAGYWSEWFQQRGCLGLVVTTVAAYFLQMVTRDAAGADVLTRYGAFDARAILGGEIWRVVTPIFLHNPFDPLHLVFNMFALYVFGSMIEGVYGTREFVGFYFAAAVCAGLAEFAIRASGLMDINVRSIGASGATTAVMVLFACHFPHRQLTLYFLIPVPAWLLVTGLIAIDMAGVFGGRGTGVNHLAHLCGAAFGAAYYLLPLRVTTLLRRFDVREPRRPVPAPPRLRTRAAEPVPAAGPVPPVAPASGPTAAADEQLEAKLDRVLEKMSATGKDSLTPEENDILRRASEIFKRRRRG